MKSRESDVEDEERRRLKSVVASISVENRAVAGEDRSPGEWPPFGAVEVESMSRTVSPSSNQRTV
ncbi:MAG TPA: hypothetical protein VKX49_14750 [Bryobacteraceae bacterium]|nr:hypothetical protein [Bryobacteraceae bacterium]